MSEKRSAKLRPLQSADIKSSRKPPVNRLYNRNAQQNLTTRSYKLNGQEFLSPRIMSNLSTHTSTLYEARNRLRKRSSKKPPFLLELENFIARELRIIQDNDDTYERFQIYQHCFQMFIEKFQLYGDILTQIKSAYELLLDEYRNKANIVPTLQTRLETLREDTSKVVRKAQVDFRNQESHLIRENINLKQRLKTMEKENRELKNELDTNKLWLSQYRKQLEDVNATKQTLARALQRLSNKRV